MTLVCIECGETCERGEGWKAAVAVPVLDELDVDEDEPNEVAVYCPTCWAREFRDA